LLQNAIIMQNAIYISKLIGNSSSINKMQNASRVCGNSQVNVTRSNFSKKGLGDQNLLESKDSDLEENFLKSHARLYLSRLEEG